MKKSQAMGGHRGLVVTATLQAWTGHAEQGQASREVNELVTSGGLSEKLYVLMGFWVSNLVSWLSFCWGSWICFG